VVEVVHFEVFGSLSHNEANYDKIILDSSITCQTHCHNHNILGQLKFWSARLEDNTLIDCRRKQPASICTGAISTYLEATNLTVAAPPTQLRNPATQRISTQKARTICERTTESDDGVYVDTREAAVRIP
jgi:hypothetical protein